MSTPSSIASEAPRLRRVLSLRDLVIYGIILVQPTAPMPLFGVVAVTAHGHVVTTVLIAMVAMMLTAISYGRMSTAYTSSGSAYTYVSREINWEAGLLTGWSMALEYIVNPLICIIWCAKSAQHILALPYSLWALFFAALFTGLNLRGIRATARTNMYLAVGMCAVITAFFVAAVRYVVGHGGVEALVSTQPFYDPKDFSWPLVSTGTSVAVLTFIGFDAVTTLSEDVQNPRRNVLLATVLTCLATGIFGGLQVYMGQLVWADYRTFPDADTAFVYAAGRAGGQILFQAVNVTLLVATIGSGMGAQLGAARLLYGMGHDDVIPRGFFSALEPRRNTPRNNLLLIGTVSLIGALLVNWELFSYQFGAELLNFGAFITFIGVNLAAIVRFFWRAPSHGARQVLVDLLPPLAGLLICLYMWWSLRPVAKLAGGAWVLLGVVYSAWKTRGFRRKLILPELPADN